MAKRTQVVLIDDLDGAPATETISFSLDGVSYDIDLSAGNAARFREAMAPYTAVGTRVGGRKKVGRRRSGDSSATDIRAWAVAEGYTVSTRGRVSSEIRAAYDAAHR